MKLMYGWILIASSSPLNVGSDRNDSEYVSTNIVNSGVELHAHYQEGQPLTLAFIEQSDTDVPSGPRSSNADSPYQCMVSTRDITNTPTARDIQDIVGRYMADPRCVPRLRATLDNLFRDEPRAEEWAGPLERIIREAAAAQEAKISGGCHTSLCSFDIELPPSEASYRSPDVIERRVIDATSGTALQTASVHFGSSSKYRVYFCSIFAPAAFVEPMRKKMEPVN